MGQIRGGLILGAMLLVLVIFFPVLTNVKMGYRIHVAEATALPTFFRNFNPDFLFNDGYDSGCGRVSATKAGMQNLKTALVNYNNDLGKWPFSGTTLSSGSLYLANEACLGDSFNKNVLVSSSVVAPFANVGLDASKYAKRWKGPYMDSDPAEFMRDAWESRIVYLYWDNKLWLQSAGPDGCFDPIDQASTSSYSGDDVVMSVGRFKPGAVRP